MKSLITQRASALEIPEPPNSTTLIFLSFIFQELTLHLVVGGRFYSRGLMDRDNSAAEHNWQTQMQFFNDLQKMLVKLTFIRLYSPFDSQLR